MPGLNACQRPAPFLSDHAPGNPCAKEYTPCSAPTCSGCWPRWGMTMRWCWPTPTSLQCGRAPAHRCCACPAWAWCARYSPSPACCRRPETYRTRWPTCPAAASRAPRRPGAGRVRRLQAGTSLLPLAEDIPHPVAYMQVGATEPPYRSALQREAVALLAGLGLDSGQAEGVERFAFYERARKAYAIVVTGELQPWGNFILRKGVICASLRP